MTPYVMQVTLVFDNFFANIFRAKAFLTHICSFSMPLAPSQIYKTDISAYFFCEFILYGMSKNFIVGHDEILNEYAREYNLYERRRKRI